VIQVEHEIEVDRPAPEVFDRLTHIESLPRWQPAIVEASLESPPPIRPGSRIRIVVVAGGQRTVAAGTVTAFERPVKIAIAAQAGSADLDATVSITPTGAESCRVALATAIRLGGFLRFVEGMARARIEAEAPAVALAVKSWLESDEVEEAVPTTEGGRPAD
jgi:uncharacterized protein YndB with AHSA1/START domain